MQALDADDPSAPSESLVSTPCPYTLAQSDPGLRLLSAGRTLGSRVVDQTLSLAGEPNEPMLFCERSLHTSGHGATARVLELKRHTSRTQSTVRPTLFKAFGGGSLIGRKPAAIIERE